MSSALWLPPVSSSPAAESQFNQVGVFVPIEAVFPDLEPCVETLERLLRRLSRTDALFCAARLNLILSNPNYHDRMNKQRYCVNNFFLPEDIARINEFVAKRKDRESAFVFFRPQLLELIRWICRFSVDLPGDGKTLNERESRRTFAQAAIVAGELWGRCVYGNKMDISDGIEAVREQCLGAVRIAQTSNTCGIDPMLAVGRGRRFFIEHFTPLRLTFPEEFKSVTSMSLQDYFGILSAMTAFYLGRTPEKVVESNGTRSGIMTLEHFSNFNPDFGKAYRTYCDFSSVSADELAAGLWSEDDDPVTEESHWHSFSIIRQRPVLRASDDRAIIIDPVLFAESAAVGPLFAILRKNKMEAPVLFTQFGKAFESYALSVLREMYPKPSAPIVDRLEGNVPGKDRAGNIVEIADACLNDVTDVVLFELKSAWISDKCADSSDTAKYSSTLSERYVNTAEGVQKGVGQLANAISRLAGGDWCATNQDFSNATTVYPVLLAHDAALQDSLHSHFLANEFRRKLAPQETNFRYEMRIGEYWVAPLIVMSIDELEILQRSVERFSLCQLLSDYSRTSPDRLLSLHNYLATSAYRDELLGPGYVADSSIHALNRAKELMSGELPHESLLLDQL